MENFDSDPLLSEHALNDSRSVSRQTEDEIALKEIDRKADSQVGAMHTQLMPKSNLFMEDFDSDLLLPEYAPNKSRSVSRQPEDEVALKEIDYEADSQAGSIAAMEDCDFDLWLSEHVLNDSRSVSRQPEDEIAFKETDRMDEEEEDDISTRVRVPSPL